MARIRIEVNKAGIRELLNSSELRADLTRRMQRVEAEAKATAPVESGEHRDSIHIEQDTTDRAVVRVVADAPHSFWVAVKTGHLARALDAAGGE